MSQTILLQKVPLLSTLPHKELDYLETTLQVVQLEPDEVLFREGEPGDCLYIVQQGRLQVLLALGASDETEMASLGPGEVIGEMSLLIPNRARTASVRAAGTSRLWTMTHTDFSALLTRRPQLALAMVRTLTQRLDATNMAAFHDLQEKNRQLQQAYDELKAAQAQIIEKEKIEHELQVAAGIQASILPHELPQVSGYDFGACMVPARYVGGDFYDVFPLDRQRIGVVIGDVADKGVPSAIFMARAHALIMSEASHGGTPGEVLRRANAHLIRLEGADLFVTVLLGILDLQTNCFSYARAGHELPLLLTAEGEVRTLPRGIGQPVGIFDELLLDENSVQLSSGVTLLLFTDGLTDGRNPAGKTFDLPRWRKVFAALAGHPAQQTCDRVFQALRKFQSSAPQEDDITLVAIHRS